MGAVEQLMDAVGKSDKMDAATKEMTTAFLQQAGPAIGTLLPDALRSVMEQLAGGNRAAAIDLVASSLSQAEVIAALGETQRVMDGLVAGQDARRAAAAALVGALEQAAVTVVVRGIVSAL